ncbi:MAG: hypothetical protein ACOY5W_12635 [Pseudomonadota bacterium]
MEFGIYDLIALLFGALFFVVNSFNARNKFLEDIGYKIGCPSAWLKNPAPYILTSTILLILFVGIGVIGGILPWWIFFLLAASAYYISIKKGHRTAQAYLDKEREIASIYEEIYNDPDSPAKLDEVLHKLLNSVNKRIKGLHADKKKLIKIATIYGIAAGYHDSDDIEDYVVETCNKYKISKSDALKFIEFYDSCNDEHVIFHITNKAQEVAQHLTDNHQDIGNQLLDIVEEFVDDPDFPESVADLRC